MSFTVPKELLTDVFVVTPTSVTLSNNNDDHDSCCGALNAIDSDLSRAVLADPEGGGVAWLRLEFDRAYVFHRIVVYNTFYTNWFNQSETCAKNEDDFRLCVDKNQNVDVSVYQGDAKQRSCGVLQLTYGLEQSDQIYTRLCNMRGNRVLFSKHGDGSFTFSEIVIIRAGDY